MSLRWRERVCLSLAPDAVGFSRWRRGWSRAPAAEGVLEVPPSPGLPAWRPVVRALAQWVQQAGPRPGDAHVVLSNHFVRYLVVPWNEALVSPAERLAFAEHSFREQFGASAQAWNVRIAKAPRGEPALACAIDGELQAEVEAVFRSTTWKLVSLQPLLMVAFNRFRRRIGKDGCLFVRERGRLGCVSVRRGRWEAVRAARVDACWKESVLERERQVLGFDWGSPSFVVDACAVPALPPDPYTFVHLHAVPPRAAGGAVALLAGA